MLLNFHHSSTIRLWGTLLQGILPHHHKGPQIPRRAFLFALFPAKWSRGLLSASLGLKGIQMCVVEESRGLRRGKKRFPFQPEKFSFPNSYFTLSQNNSETHFRTSTKNVTSCLHLSMNKCHAQKQRGLGKLGTKCSDGTDPLTGAMFPLWFAVRSDKNMISSILLTGRPQMNFDLRPHTAMLCWACKPKRLPQKMNVCSVFIEMHPDPRRDSEKKEERSTQEKPVTVRSPHQHTRKAVD